MLGAGKALEKRVERERRPPDVYQKRMSWLGVRVRKRSVPGTRFFEKRCGKPGSPGSNLSGRVGLSLLQPPGNGLHKQCGHEVWHKTIRERMGKEFRGVSSVRKASALFDQVGERCAHLPHKPGAALAAQQRSIQPFVLGDMLEEGDPNLCGMFLPEISDCRKQRTHCFFKDLLNQIIFILIITVESGTAHQCPLGNLADGQRLEPPLLYQVNECLTQQFLGPSYSEIAR